MFGVSFTLCTKTLYCCFSHQNSRHPYPWNRLRRPVLVEIAARRQGRSANNDDNDSNDDNDNTNNGIRIAPYEGFEQGRLHDKVAEVRGERMAALISATLDFVSAGWLTFFVCEGSDWNAHLCFLTHTQPTCICFSLI
jgi:hypothetical protein